MLRYFNFIESLIYILLAYITCGSPVVHANVLSRTSTIKMGLITLITTFRLIY